MCQLAAETGEAGKEWTSPHENVSLLLYHDKVHAAVLVLSHERVWDEVEEYVGQESACLHVRQIHSAIPNMALIGTYCEGGHGVQSVGVDLRWDEREDEIGDSRASMRGRW